MSADATTPDAPAETPVNAERGEQCGYTIWGGTCPCGRRAWLNDLGRILCACGRLLRYVDPTEDTVRG